MGGLGHWWSFVVIGGYSVVILWLIGGNGGIGSFDGHSLSLVVIGGHSVVRLWRWGREGLS